MPVCPPPAERSAGGFLFFCGFLRALQKYENGKGGLSINIEGEPRNTEKGEAAREAVRHAAQSGSDDDRPALREEAIRQILEEFLA